MDDLKVFNTNSIANMRNSNKAIDMPKPFARDIFLFDTLVAGTTHISGIEELADYMNVGDRLDFFREVDNSHDEMAIIIKTENGAKIGYVPQKDNVVFARLMDAGKELFAKINKISKKGNWIKIDIDIYLSE